MCKKALSWILTVAMVLSFVVTMPITANAQPPEYNCQIVETGVEYQTLDAALDAVMVGQTIQLLTDIEYNSMITVEESFIIDINDNDLTVNVVDQACIYSGDRHVLSIVDHGLSEAEGAFYAYTSGDYWVGIMAESLGSKISIETTSLVSVTGDYSDGIYAWNGGEVYLAGNISVVGTNSYAATANSGTYGGLITINGEIESTEYLRVNSHAIAPEQYILPTTKAGYLTYIYGDDDADPQSTIWVKEAATETPIISGQSVWRSSASTANVRFMSSEAGTYYYTITDDDTVPSTADLSGWTTGAAIAADTTVTLSPSGLTAGELHVHIVVEDGSGNVSDPLSIAMPYDYYYFENFETYPLDTNIASNAMSPLAQRNGGSGSTAQKVITDGSEKRLSLTSNYHSASDQHVLLDAGTLAAADVYVFEGDVYPLLDSGFQLRFSFANGSYEGSNEAGVFFNGGKITTASGSSSNIDSAFELKESYTANEWHHIKIAAAPGTGKYAVYLDDVLLNASLTLPSGIDRLAISAGNLADGTTAYYDNLKFYIIPAPVVCKILDTNYSSLGAALEAVSSGQTIILQDNITYNDRIWVGSSYYPSFNLDLNGFELEIANVEVPIAALDGYSLTVTDDSVSGGGALTLNTTSDDSAPTGIAAAGMSSSVSVDNKVEATITATGGNSKGIYAGDGGNVEIGNGTIRGDDYGAYSSYNGNCTVHGNVILTGDSGYGIYAQNSGTVTVYGNVIASQDDCCGVYAASASYIQIDGYMDAYYYISLEGSVINSDQYYEPTTLPNYYTYTDGNNTVWVKLLLAAPPSADNISVSGTASEGETLTGSYDFVPGSEDSEGVSTFRWLKVSGTPSLLGEPYLLFTTNNVGGVTSDPSGPPNPASFTVAGNTKISKISDYHYASSDTPGTISLQESGGTVYGPWNAVLDGYWRVYPDITVPAGTYTVIDSKPASWSFNTESGNAGMTEIVGYTEISGATGQSYVLQGEDVGKSILFEVTARDILGHAGSPVMSDPIGPVSKAFWSDGITSTSQYPFGGGDGSSVESAWEISTQQQLAQLAYNVNSGISYSDKYFILTADIDLYGKQWLPIGNAYGNAFAGNFNGDGHSVSGLTMTEVSGVDAYGLFGNLGADGIIEDLTVESGTIAFSESAGNGYFGGIAGYSLGLVEDCINKADITITNDDWTYAGGIVGYGPASILGCHNEGDIQIGFHGSVGGIIGYQSVTYVDHCSNSGNVTGGSSAEVGGIAGRIDNAGTIGIVNCFNTGNVTSGDGSTNSVYAGGIVGYEYYSKVKDCYNTGSVTLLYSSPGNTFCGGISGHADIAAENCYNVGTVNGTGLAGEGINGAGIACTNCYYLDTSTPSNAIGGITRLTASEMKNQSSFVNWGFPDTWTINHTDNNGYPALAWQGFSHGIASSDATLSALSVSGITLTQVFEGETINYTANASNSISSTTVSATASDGAADISINGTTGTSKQIALNVGSNVITIEVTAEDGIATKTYTITITRAASTVGGGGGGGSITPTDQQITVSTPDGGTVVTGTLTKSASAEKITISGTQLKTLAETNQGAMIPAPAATVTFDAKAINAIIGAPSTGDVVLTIEKLDPSTMKPEQQKRIGDRPVYDFTLTKGGRQISGFDGGHATISIPYTLATGENPHQLVIYYLTSDGTLKPVIGHYDAKSECVVFETTHFSTYAVGYNPVSFNDLAPDAWYKNAVEFIAAREITSGTSDGVFSPEAKLTRGQFIVLLMNAYGISPDADDEGATNFGDAGNTYYTDYLLAAKSLGIVNGVGNTMFAPEQAITRQEMFVMLYNALEVIGQLPQAFSDKPLSDFGDADQVASWAQEAMSALIEGGVISGSNGMLNPGLSTTRAEMAQMLYNLLSK